jgi:hypothetical protein
MHHLFLTFLLALVLVPLAPASLFGSRLAPVSVSPLPVSPNLRAAAAASPQASAPPATPAFLAPASIGGGRIQSGVISGTLALLNEGGLLGVVDVRDPRSPRRRALLPVTFNELAVAGHYAYLATQEGLQVVDVSNLDAPQLLGITPTSSPSFQIALAAERAYLGTEDGVAIMDLADPAAPRPRGFVPSLQPIDLLAEEQKVYVSHNGSLSIIDAVNPEAPRLIGQLQGNAFDVDGDTLYVEDARGRCGPSAPPTEHRPGESLLRVPICQAGRYALFGPTGQMRLPLAIQ